jgi:hypothetical protein
MLLQYLIFEIRFFLTNTTKGCKIPVKKKLWEEGGGGTELKIESWPRIQKVMRKWSYKLFEEGENK